MPDLPEEYFELPQSSQSPATPAGSASHDNARNLDKCLLQYIIHSDNSFFPENLATWTNFLTFNAYNFNHFAFLSITELRDTFINVVLPKIFTYDLSASEKQVIDVLSLNPQYRKTEMGYQRLPKEERRSMFEPRRNVDYIVGEEDDPQSDENEESSTVAKKPKIACFVLREAHAERIYQQHKVNLSPDIHAWLSAVLSTDFELATCHLLMPKEICKCLNDAHDNFDKRAVMPQNLLLFQSLKEKMMNFYNIRKDMTSAMDTFF